MLNRRAALKLLASLPFVGGLFAATKSTAAVPVQSYRSSFLVSSVTGGSIRLDLTEDGRIARCIEELDIPVEENIHWSVREVDDFCCSGGYVWVMVAPGVIRAFHPPVLPRGSYRRV